MIQRHTLVLEYVANPKRKALSVLRFTKTGEDDGLYQVNSAFHAATRDILGERAAEDDGGSGIYLTLLRITP